MGDAADLTKSLTALFADMAGSTTLYAERGDVEGHRIASQCIELLESQVRAVGGRVIKRIGDEILAVFDTADAAVRAASGMHQAFETHAADLRREGVHVRIGMATGSAVVTEDDVFGDVVNVAARLVALAGMDEILLSGDTADALPDALRSSTRRLETLALRGRAERVVVCDYLWQSEPEGATIAAGDRTSVRRQLTLELRWGTETFSISAACPKITIGRDATNAIAIAEQVVSRHHADVVMRGDKFVLIDRSTNGTYVLADNGEKLRVTRDEVRLTGSGSICPGSKQLEPIYYRIVVA
jgi:class 3 adenylate cyclase